MILFFLPNKNMIFSFFHKLKLMRKNQNINIFENEIMEVHRQYNLRSKKSNDNPTKKASNFRKITNTPAKKFSDSPPNKNLEVLTKRTSESE
jgi:hypothetical protein